MILPNYFFLHTKVKWTLIPLEIFILTKLLLFIVCVCYNLKQIIIITKTKREKTHRLFFQKVLKRAWIGLKSLKSTFN